MSKGKRTLEQAANDTIKNALNTLIKYISIIAIFIALGVIILLYAGPQLNFTTGIVFRLAVPSIVLSISVVIINELWIVNGRRSASEEKEYQDLLKEYATKSENLHYPTTQEFLDSEYNRRYDVEVNRLTRKLERENELLPKIEALFVKGAKRRPTLRDRYERWLCKRNIRVLTRELGTIRVSIPYEKSEEFDYLRYNIMDIVYKEYAPEDAAKHLARARTKKYINTFTFTIVGLNLFSVGGTMGDFWVAVVMSSLAAVTLIMTVVSGFSTGYHNVKVISTGIYKTANSFLDQAVAYCKRTGKDLYYKGTTEFRTVTPVVTQPAIVSVTVEKEADIFTKAAKEVTQS